MADNKVGGFNVLFVAFIYTSAFLVVASLLRIYVASIKYLGIDLLFRLSLASVVASIVLFILNPLINLNITFIISVISCTYIILLTVGYRVGAREFLYSERQRTARRALIYGTGASAIEFVSSSMQGNSLNVVGFMDDDPNLIGTSFRGKMVFSPDEVGTLISKFGVTVVVLAIPKASKSQRKDIIEKLLPYPLRVLTVPDMNEILDGSAGITEAREIDIEDLLARETVIPDQAFLRENVEGKIILISGAGGSIGGELTRQISKLSPKKLILLDSSESGLFSIEQELTQTFKSFLVPVLGSITDSKLVDFLFKTYGIDTVYHAAAYKHVPLVEANPFVAVTNNVLGTATLLNSAIINRCQSFTLISTDKAVRPTNVMGATKRLAELICQAAANEPSNTKISIVRFGNVLGSSGSAIPTFREQIRCGGPVTVTHPDITRYFMTIREAAQLVIQASSIADNGDVVLLDMGELIKMSELAERMIRLAGRTVANEDQEQAPGAIQIVYTGLRPGEKLYEELLIDADSQVTSHPRIMKAKEFFIDQKELQPLLSSIYIAAESRNFTTLKEYLLSVNIGYQPKVGNKVDRDFK
ncbi:polysaccharide biosynthesis protein [Alphaproteobacteria bacterium]|nr:polysaccharide biosynthesis protein [Alphaproteobacteria bacterium]MDC1085854.1 nucleoside-diphosphate sugar epimerase/dehydratase [Alphaproteobacteria bacterium]